MVLELGGNIPGHDDGLRRRRTTTAGGRKPGRTLLYERVAQLAEQIITEDNLQPGDVLPSYTELAQRAGVSLITVRRALDELERSGRVRRHQGLGTFVAQPPAPVDADRGSMLGALVASGTHVTRRRARVLDLRQGAPSESLRHTLGISGDSPVWQFRRLWLLDDEPAALCSAIIPVALAAGLDQMIGRVDVPLHELLQNEYSLTDLHSEQCLQVVDPTREETELLGIADSSQVIRIRGMSADAIGTPFGCFQQLFPAHRFAFAMAGRAVRRLIPAPGHWDWEVSPVT